MSRAPRKKPGPVEQQGELVEQRTEAAERSASVVRGDKAPAVTFEDDRRAYRVEVLGADGKVIRGWTTFLWPAEVEAVTETRLRLWVKGD